MSDDIRCTCGARALGTTEHLPWCARFLEGVDVSAPVAREPRHRLAAQIAVDAAIERAADAVCGPANLEELVIAWWLSREDELRASHAPDHPAIAMLDEYLRERKEGA